MLVREMEFSFFFDGVLEKRCLFVYLENEFGKRIPNSEISMCFVHETFSVTYVIRTKSEFVSQNSGTCKKQTPSFPNLWRIKMQRKRAAAGMETALTLFEAPNHNFESKTISLCPGHADFLPGTSVLNCSYHPHALTAPAAGPSFLFICVVNLKKQKAPRSHEISQDLRCGSSSIAYVGRPSKPVLHMSRDLAPMSGDPGARQMGAINFKKCLNERLDVSGWGQ
jgi:hypothetical protein